MAQLAHLELAKKNSRSLDHRSPGSFNYVEQLNELDTANVEPALGGLTPEGEKTDSSRDDESRLRWAKRPRSPKPRSGRRPFPRSEGALNITCYVKTVEQAITAAENLNENAECVSRN